MTDPDPTALRSLARAALAKFQCPTIGCGGRGWYQDTEAAHAYGCDGSCSSGECPVPVAVQVQCDWCAQYESVPALARAVLELLDRAGAAEKALRRYRDDHDKHKRSGDAFTQGFAFDAKADHSCGCPLCQEAETAMYDWARARPGEERELSESPR